MRMTACIPVFALLIAAGCHRQTVSDAVERNYDNRADAIDRTAAAQPTPVAKDFYHDQADALRQEGQDRAKGLDKAGVGHAPAMPENQTR